MSSLYDFTHHQMGVGTCKQKFRTIPPDVPENQKDASSAPVSGTISGNAKANEARFTGALKGDLYYSQWEAENTHHGRVENHATVLGKVIEKEIFPLG